MQGDNEANDAYFLSVSILGNFLTNRRKKNLYFEIAILNYRNTADEAVSLTKQYALHDRQIADTNQSMAMAMSIVHIAPNRRSWHIPQHVGEAKNMCLKLINLIGHAAMLMHALIL